MIEGNTYKTNLSKAIEILEQEKIKRNVMVNELCEVLNSLEEENDITIEEINKRYKDIAFISLHIKGLEDGISNVNEKIKVIIEDNIPIPSVIIDTFQ